MTATIDKTCFRYTGALSALSADERAALLRRRSSTSAPVRERTAEIVRRVREDGDRALLEMAATFDGVSLESIEVPRAARQKALELVDAAVRAALTRAARNIELFHSAGFPRSVEIETEPGVTVGRRPDPLRRVGIYAPGGRAAYASSVLMAAVPARVAGVSEIIVCSPPQKDGYPAAIVLAACELAGVDRVFALGGAGAVAAMAYGTESMPAVDRIVGPGNSYVAEAKLQVSRDVGIDSPAGPSELLVVCDAGADADTVAREVIAQAEHDVDACVSVVALDEATATAVSAAIETRLPDVARADVVRAALEQNGAILCASSIEEAIEFANAFAPEHLLLAVTDADGALRDVRNAGCVFVGESSSVVFGDYITGGNHVLPTGGLARSYSGLGTLDFVRWTSYQRVTPDAAQRLADNTAILAAAEGLPGHAVAALGWSGGGKREAGGGRREAGSGKRGWRPRLQLRESYRGLALYSTPAGQCDIDLSDNTNLWGAPPTASRVLASPDADVSRYPVAYEPALATALADYAGVPPEMIACGCGSDDVLDSAIRAFGEPGNVLCLPAPSFSMIPFFARTNGLRPIAIPLTRSRLSPPAPHIPLSASWDIDVEGILQTDARIIYLCSPNNPTGTALSRATVEEIVDRAPGLVIIDQAYAEFGGDDFTDLARRGRVLVTRTMSKAFGLAGLRVGYGIGSPELITEVLKARGPYKVNVLAERAAIAALESDRSWVRDRANEVVANRSRFSAALAALGIHSLESAANFVLVPVDDCADSSRKLERAGIRVRPFAALPGIGDAIRIAIGPWEAMERCVDALASDGKRDAGSAKRSPFSPLGEAR
ncbi:MAG TPA: histidinol dehydrogenase [Gemmatimonadaceae bacterium]|nr:histidinol dehydrogenase [Gemmatimonadaceae bacterium]